MNAIFAKQLAQAFQYFILYLFGTSLNTLENVFSDGDQKAYENSQSTSAGEIKYNQQEVYDFIVVGGGSAGSVLANRLTEENFTVLLIEAGGYPFPLTHIPAMTRNMLLNPNIDWGDQVVPQKDACLALKNNGTIYNRGKVLGGGSTLNYLMYMRGNPNDFNNWAQETGDPSWEYWNVLPFFKKLENYQGYFPNDEYHGSGGPLHVEPTTGPMFDDWLEAGKELGYPIKDPNTNQVESFFPIETTTKQGTRFSTYRAYIHPILSRPNLKIRIYSHVTKIQFDSKNRATGVNYVYKGREHFASAKKEVILSAGALSSPQILMLSGLGPEQDLKELGIPVRVNLPVGKNLQDHIVSSIGPFLVDDGKFSNSVRGTDNMMLHEYIHHGTGPFSSLQITGGAILASSLVNSSWPDLYLVFNSFVISDKAAALLQHAHGFREGLLQKYLKSSYGRDAFFIVICLGRTESRGELKLRSANPFDKVIIDPMYFSHPNDMAAMMEGVKYALKIGNDTEVFKRIGSKLTSSLFPGCEEFGGAESEEYWKCFVRHWSCTMWHYTSTCRMGKGTGDPNAVVDSNLRVIGTSNLRVIDGSIIPNVTNANTNIPIIMIAEKGADMIKQFWKFNTIK